MKGRYEITEHDPEHSVVDEIAYRLQEPKKDLIERVVRVVGTKKAIELLGQTATLEENGGVYTLDGSRRRTPGGVYLNLLKNTPSITGAQVRVHPTSPIPSVVQYPGRQVLSPVLTMSFNTGFKCSLSTLFLLCH